MSAKCVVYIRALSFADVHVVKRKALKKVLGFYTDYASSFDKELRLAVNICELQHVKKVKRRKRGASTDFNSTPGITRLIGPSQNQHDQESCRSRTPTGKTGNWYFML